MLIILDWSRWLTESVHEAPVRKGIVIDGLEISGRADVLHSQAIEHETSYGVHIQKGDRHRSPGKEETVGRRRPEADYGTQKAQIQIPVEATKLKRPVDAGLLPERGYSILSHHPLVPSVELGIEGGKSPESLRLGGPDIPNGGTLERKELFARARKTTVKDRWDRRGSFEARPRDKPRAIPVNVVPDVEATVVTTFSAP